MARRTQSRTDPEHFAVALAERGLTIYDAIKVGDPKLWIPTPELESLLDQHLRGLSLAGLPLRTRSKTVKQHVCRALGYPVPDSFKRTQPRFPGQLLDTYVQKSNNLQIWNEELAPTRRYALIRVGENDTVLRVKVVTGDSLAKLDTTGTLTQKHQARCILGTVAGELIANQDTERLRPFVSAAFRPNAAIKPLQHPENAQLLPI